jgi:hypothetical protein
VKPTRTHALVALVFAMGIGFVATRVPALDASPTEPFAREFDPHGATLDLERRPAENSAALVRHRWLEGWTPPRASSPQPDEAEWGKSEKVTSPLGCEAHRTREWLRFDCPLSGPVRSWGVSISCRGACDDVKTTMTSEKANGATTQMLHVILPVRPAVRRWVEVISNVQDPHAAYGVREESPRTLLRVSEDWPDQLILVVS